LSRWAATYQLGVYSGGQNVIDDAELRRTNLYPFGSFTQAVAPLTMLKVRILASLPAVPNEKAAEHGVVHGPR